MSTVADLMGLGFPGPLANRLGNTPATITCVGTANTTTAIIQTGLSLLVTAGGATACIFNSGASLGRPFWVFNTTATTALVFPPVGGNFNNGSTDASFSVLQNKGAMFMRTSSTVWMVILTA